MKSGMLAAEAAFEAISAERGSDALVEYAAAFEKSWVHQLLLAPLSPQLHETGSIGSLFQENHHLERLLELAHYLLCRKRTLYLTH